MRLGRRRRHGTASLLATAGASLLALAGCGRPSPPDLRGEVAKAVQPLGARAFCPFVETARIGGIYLVDASTPRLGSRLPSWQITNFLVSEELVPGFADALAAWPSVRARFPQSHDQLPSHLRPATTGHAFYRQVAAPATGTAPTGSLPLAAMPSYSLASVDQAALGASVPNVWTSFLVGLGLRNSSYLRMEPEAVEVAELPLAAVLETIRAACIG